MEKNFQKEEGISLLDIVRLLLSKIKLLILVVLGGAILGGAYAVVTTMNVDYYGTTVQFYVNPESDDDDYLGSNNSQYGVYGAYSRYVMDNMVKLLNSESFTEQLILNYDANIDKETNTWKVGSEFSVLPQKSAETAKYAGLDGLIDSANAAIAASDAKTAEANAVIETASKAYATLVEEWDKAVFGSNYDSSSSADNYEKLSKVAPSLITAELENAYNAYEGDFGLKAQAATAKEAAKAEAKKAETATNTALDAWSKTSSYKAKLSTFSRAVSYSYLQENEDADDANNLARSFIYVKIRILNNADFAEELLEVIKNVVPAYVESNMTVPAGYSGTNCQRITRSDDISLTNPGYTRNQAIKYAVLLAAVAFVIACVIIIIVDKSDKRLRDYDVLTKQFNVPILGVVPTIEMPEANPSKKKATKNDTEVK